MKHTKLSISMIPTLIPLQPSPNIIKALPKAQPTTRLTTVGVLAMSRENMSNSDEFIKSPSSV